MPFDLEHITTQLQQQLPGATLTCQTLPGTGDLQLYLINPEFDDRDLPLSVTEFISDDPPYWIFCWASGRALAQMIMSGELDVRGKSVLDFGSGSGVVAIAAKLARAARVCDIDPLSHSLVELNSAANSVTIETQTDLNCCARHYDEAWQRLSATRI